MGRFDIERVVEEGREKCSTNFGKTKNLNNFVCDYSKNPFLNRKFFILRDGKVDDIFCVSSFKV